ncbi:MAG: GGDEF domain-containing protein [Acidobacteriota bacterium]
MSAPPDDNQTDEHTTADVSKAMEKTIFSDHDTSELSDLARRRGELVFEASLILFAHPEDRMLGTRFRLPPHEVLEIGRSSSCDISMPGIRSLSRVHARLEHLGAVVRIEDLKSTNGTYVNDVRIDGARRLRSGDRFQVGALHFKFLHEKDPESAYHEAIYQLVTHDGLTGILNKRTFEDEMRREFDRAKRHGRPLSLVFFDIDHFKAINDTHGHLAGDFVLQQVARLTEPFLRPEQVFARVGGEEFVILCPETDEQGAASLAEKLRARFALERYRYVDTEIELSCSFGVAAATASMTEPVQLYGLADAAMYASKNAGRNRVTVRRAGSSSDL